MREVLSERWREAPVRPELLAAMVFLDELGSSPRSISAADVESAYAAGLERIDLEHAVIVGFVFHTMNRLVDSFGADVTEEQAAKLGTLLDNAGKLLSNRPRKKKDAPLGDPLPEFVTELLASIREGPGDAPRDVRAAIEARVAASCGAERPSLPLPPDVEAFVMTIADDAHALTDEHFAELRAGGWSEEAIYELVFVAAAATGVGRLEVAWSAMRAQALGNAAERESPLQRKPVE